VLVPPIRMTRLSEVGALVGLAAIGAITVTAFLGAAVATLGLGAPFWHAYRTWLIAGALGMLMVCPLVLTAAHSDPPLFPRRAFRRSFGDLVVFVLLIFSAYLIFRQIVANNTFLLVLPYLTFPFLLWIAVRRGPRGAAISSLALSCIAVWETVRGRGPFAIAGVSMTEHILAVQVYLGVAILSALVVAAVMSERLSLEGALEQSERRFRATFNSQFQFIGLMLPNGTLIEANQTALELGGLEPGDVLGKPFWCTHWWSLSSEAQQRLREAIQVAAGGEFVRYGVEIRGAANTTTPIDFSIKPVYDEQQRVTLLIAEGRDIAEIKHATQALVEQEATLRSFFDSAGSMMGIVEVDEGEIRHIRDNAASRAFFQLTTEMQDLSSARRRGVRDDVIAMWISHYRESAARGMPVQFEYQHPSKDGMRWLSATVCPITPTAGSSPRFAYVVQDITALKQQAERLMASLAEKEVLLREIHHRVKNNLQVISSMLHLQRRHVSEASVRAQLVESERRVHAMSLVHEQLYMAADLAGVEFPSYVDRLVATLMSAYRSSVHGIAVRMRIAPLMLDIDTAIPCGLLINELVSNSLAHAFRGDEHNEIRVTFERTGPEQLTLSVGDNGIGLPPEIDVMTARSMGLQLIRALVAQVGGTLRCERQGGTEISVVFPCPPGVREASKTA